MDNNASVLISTASWSNGADAIVMAGPVHYAPPANGFMLLMLIIFALVRSKK